MAGRIVKFNIGGKRYFTTEATLRKRGDNRLLQAAQHPSIGTDGDGYIFFDGNGRAFQMVLDYLREGCIYPRDLTPLQVLQEFHRYGVSLPPHWILLHKSEILEEVKLQNILLPTELAKLLLDVKIING